MGETNMKPIFCEPVYIESVWAGDRLKKIRNLNLDNIGICREICAYKNSENKIMNPEYAGMTFKDLIERHHDELIGKSEDNQLIRVAYIDAIEDLSIQVHPNEEQAKLIGDYEKSESWYIIDCDDGATLVAGTKIEDKEVLKQAAIEGTMQEYVNEIPVKPGDFVMVPSTMLHACGKNMLAIEIGSFGGITYRLYDYGRPRGLDIEKGFEIVDPTVKTTIYHFPLEQRVKTQIKEAIRHQLFNTDILDIADETTIHGNGKYYILTCVDGNCSILNGGDCYSLDFTRTVLIPASAGDIQIKGNCRIIRSYR